MSKRTKKINNYNTDIISILIKRYDYSADYIRKCLRGDRIGIMPDKIIEEYKKIEAASKTAIQQKATEL